jgi:hypothetical protein
MWMDADTWVQHANGILWHVEALRRGADLVITPEADRAYGGTGNFTGTWYNNLSTVYGAEKAYQMLLSPIMNGGLWAARANGRLWKAWQSQMMSHAQTGAELLQMATLQYIVMNGEVRSHFLPATCNWMCCRSKPMLDVETGTLMTPLYPHEDIQILHLHAGIWRNSYDLRRSDGQIERTLIRYSAKPNWQKASSSCLPTETV